MEGEEPSEQWEPFGDDQSDWSGKNCVVVRSNSSHAGYSSGGGHVFMVLPMVAASCFAEFVRPWLSIGQAYFQFATSCNKEKNIELCSRRES